MTPEVAVDGRLLMCYNKTAFTPGRYLEDGLRRIGVSVDVRDASIDFREVNLDAYRAVLFVESPGIHAAEIKGIERVSSPKLFWVHHGANRLLENVRLCELLRPDLVLMAHSLELANRFPAPVRFFPFATAPDIFNCVRPLCERTFDIAFVGNTSEGVYNNRRALLRAIREHFRSGYRISLGRKVFVRDLASLYGNTKIVVNCVADKLKTINMRLFEGMGCGALVLTDPAPHQSQLFTDGTHYVEFSDIPDAVDKLEHYLNHLNEAQAIATAGHRYVSTQHTYADRAHALLSEIEQIRAQSRRFHVSNQHRFET